MNFWKKEKLSPLEFSVTVDIIDIGLVKVFRYVWYIGRHGKRNTDVDA